MIETEILYKAQNSKSLIFTTLFCVIYSIGIAIAIAVFSAKYFSANAMSINSPFVWIPLLLIIISILSLTTAISTFFSSYICLTKEYLLIKEGKNCKVVPYKNIRLIKKCSANKRTYTLIKQIDGKDILAPDIKSINELSNQIRILYPEFNNREGIIQGYDSNINASIIWVLFYFGIATYFGQKIINAKVYSLAVQFFWYGIILLYFLGLIKLIKLIPRIKMRYFSEETKMMLASIKASEKERDKQEDENFKQLKEQEEESIITNYCPLCGNKLIDFKCDRCEVNLDNIYDVKKFYCMNCGTKRKDLEPECLKCGLGFNL